MNSLVPVERLLRKACLIAATLMLASPGAFGQPVVRLVVPYGVGGATDALARAIAPGLSERLGQTIVVENKAGASGVIGLEHVAKAPPDGLTIGLVASAVITSYPAVEIAQGRKLRVDPLKDVVPVSLVGTVDEFICVYPPVPAKSMKELFAHAKANPGGLAYATTGIDPTYLTMESLGKKAGITLTPVPFGGQAPGAVALVGGHVQFSSLNAATAAPLIHSGKIRALAVAGPDRNPDFPELPTTAEAGFPDIDTVSWMAFLLPAKASPAVVDRLHSALVSVMADSDLQARIKKIGIQPTTSSADALAGRIRSEMSKWTRITKEVPLPETK
ncbi:MAG: Bug family tripartite tricarboxylate transporter substrate binding protein [Lautropia sp.]